MRGFGWRRNANYLEHKSVNYSPLTYHNASVADITIAIAVDHNTAGERCTQKAVAAAKKQIIKLEMSEDYLNMARTVWRAVKDTPEPTINIAGNGIYTLQKAGWTQEKVNRIVHDILAKVHEHYPIKKIVSGGQTRADLAGGVAAYKLGIDCEMTLPKGFIMRFQNGKDYEHSEEFVRKLVVGYAEKL